MASECYGKLADQYPQHVDYKLNYAHALYNAFMLPEAVAVLLQIDDPKYANKVVKLDAAIKYQEEDLINARILLEQFESDDPDMEINMACLDFKVVNIHKHESRIFEFFFRSLNTTTHYEGF